MKKILLSGLLLFFVGNLLAQTKLPNGSEISLDGEFRTLAEFRQGYKDILAVGSDPAWVISQRSRLILNYKNDKFDMRFSMQDVRAWGETFIINSTKPLLLHEAWIKYKFNHHLALTIGRQALQYGDKRIISDRNWSQYGAAFDAAVLNYQKNDLTLDFGLALNNNSDKLLTETPYLINNYKSMSFLWISKEFSPSFTLNFIDVFAAYQKPETIINYGLNTVGFNPEVRINGFDLNSSAYYQFGKNQLGNKHQAHLYTANLSYTQQIFRATAGYDHYSGKKYNDLSSKDMYFHQLIETVPHSFLGFMDFVKGSQFQKQYGISDLNFNLKYGKETTFTAYYHALAYAAKPGADISKKIGDEFDFVLTHKFNQSTTLDFGYSFMVPNSDFILTALNSN